MAQKTAKLNSGFEIPLFGLGTWRAEPGLVGQAVKDSLKLGYRHIDCAAVYQNEDEVGKAIADFLADPANNLKREDLFITSKLWNTAHKREQVKPACLKTLKDLQLTYLDLYLIHVPVAHDEKGQPILVPLQETWQAMEELVKEGLVRSIGISNFPTALVNDLLSYAKIPPAVNQIERHPYLVQPEHVAFLTKHNIHATGYSPLGAGDFLPNAPKVLQDPVVLSLAKKYNRTPAQILINWHLTKGYSVIPKSVKKERLEENLKATEFVLSEEDWQELSKLDRRARYLDQSGNGVHVFT
eukprot:TRINITY_DN2125_c0_g1_i1.p1 TRINITY_DN2125_c0_g1~~TRINITY_DN2125_c0_g1_i1.p1  ORF type:complete len:316 (-),score=101.44 TRINITY_DN2125_c0_g1_i1:28-921(-)